MEATATDPSVKNNVQDSDKHCSKLIKVALIYKKVMFVISFFGFFGICFWWTETFGERDAQIFFALLTASLVTFFNVISTIALYELANVIAEIARNTRSK